MEKLTYCTIARAAEILGVSLSQVARYVQEGKLTSVTPWLGTGESGRHKGLLDTAEVYRFRDARKVIGKVVGSD